MTLNAGIQIKSNNRIISPSDPEKKLIGGSVLLASPNSGLLLQDFVPEHAADSESTTAVPNVLKCTGAAQ